MKTLTLPDGFRWKLLTEREAMNARSRDEEVYILFPDGSESLVESFDEILNCDSDCQLGQEMGHINTQKHA
jgi:hypothetical protein